MIDIDCKEAGILISITPGDLWLIHEALEDFWDTLDESPPGSWYATNTERLLSRISQVVDDIDWSTVTDSPDKT